MIYLIYQYESSMAMKTITAATQSVVVMYNNSTPNNNFNIIS